MTARAGAPEVLSPSSSAPGRSGDFGGNGAWPSASEVAASAAPSTTQRAQASAMPGAATGGVRLLLRIEGLAMATAAVAAYAQHGLGWSAFAWLFLLPDAAFLGYLAGARIGAMAYDATHSTIGPLALLSAGMLGGLPTATALALVWFAHVGFDHALGYGLKYARGFTATHLGRIGRQDPW